MKFNADAIIAANAGNAEKVAIAKAYAAYNSASGRPTKEMLAIALRSPIDILARLCAERGISVGGTDD